MSKIKLTATANELNAQFTGDEITKYDTNTGDITLDSNSVITMKKFQIETVDDIFDSTLDSIEDYLLDSKILSITKPKYI